MKKINTLLSVFLLSVKIVSAQWTEVGIGANGLNANNYVYTLKADAAGNLYAAGCFTDTAGNYSVAKWDGTSWNELGTGTNALNINECIYTLAIDNAGNVYAAGNFDNASHECIVEKWNGSSWSEIGTFSSLIDPVNSRVNTMAIDAGNNVYVAGTFTTPSGFYYVAKWDGTSWSELGTGANALNANSVIQSIEFDTAGNLYAGGDFTNSSNYTYVAKWNGTSWAQLGSDTIITDAACSLCTVHTISVDAAGNIYASGAIQTMGHNYVAKWNGVQWNKLAIDTNNLFAGLLWMMSDATGNLYACGKYDGYGNQFLLKTDGGSWSFVDSTKFPQQGGNSNTFIRGITEDANGNLFVARLDTGTEKYTVIKYPANTTATLTLKSEDKKFSVYPNPTSSIVNIELKTERNKAEISLYNLLGEKLIQENISSNNNSVKNQFDLSEYPNGAYFISVKTDKENMIQKIIKQN